MAGRGGSVSTQHLTIVACARAAVEKARRKPPGGGGLKQV